MRILLLLLASLLSLYLSAAEEPVQDEETSWWEARHERSDIYFPHNAHREVMSLSADSCMSCHPFTGTKITDLEQLESVEVISNEPLEAICHSCHMQTRSAPMACEVCHPDSSTIRPPDHQGDYTWFHTEAARSDEAACRVCHIDLNFCTDCHFRRNPAERNMHPLGYRDRHGLEARMTPTACASCHQANYCSDCHAGRRR